MMAYPRRYRKRTYQGRKKTPWYNKRYNALQLAKKAAQGVWYLKGLVNSEMLKQDQGITNTLIDATTGNVFSYAQMIQGDGVTNRTGNSVLVRSILTRLRIIKASSPTATYVRMYIVQDNQQISDTVPLISDLLQANDVDSALSRDTPGRFKILLSKTIVLTNNNPTFHIEKVHNLRHHIRFNGTTGADVQKGGLYLMLLSDQTSSANQPTLDGWLRINYHDN